MQEYTQPHSGKAEIVKTHVAYTVNQNERQHPGARAVEPAPDNAYSVRGNLYITLELFPLKLPDESAAPAEGYSGANISHVNKQLLSVVQETYYAAKGSPVQVVTAAISAAHQMLRKINAQQPEAPFGAGIGGAALLGKRLIIATSGPIISLIASDESILQFPSELSTALAGVHDQPDPTIQTYQRLIENGGALFLGSSAWLNYVPPRELLGMVAHLNEENSQRAAHHISQQSRFETIPGLFLAMAGNAQSDQATSSSQVAPAQIEQPQSTRPAGGLPTSVHATTSRPQQPNLPQAPTPQSLQRRQEEPPQAIQPQFQSEARIEPRTAPPQPLPSQAPQPATGRTVEQQRPMPRVIPEELAAYEEEYGLDDHFDDEYVAKQPRQGPSIISQIGAVFDRLLKPRDRTARESAQQSSSIRGVDADTSRASMREPLMTEAEYRISKGWSDEPAGEPLYIEPKPASGGRARLFLTLAALILVLVPLVVFAYVMSQGVSSRAQAESLIDAAAAQIGSAEVALDAGDNGLASARLQEAEQYLIEADRLKGDRNRISQLSARVQQNFQSVSQVAPFYMLVEPLVRFPADASPSRVMVVNQDVYILDRGRNHILRFRLGPNGETIPDPNGEVVLRQGDRIDGFEVGPLIDMAWQTPSVGNEEKSNLIVLDSNNQVFRYNQVVDGPSRLAFGNQELWQSPTQIQSYLGRFYVADSGRGQIYRYSPGNFEGEPDEWLSAPTAQSLSSLLSMVIDGDIWMLFSSGQLVRYREGLTVPFTLDNDVGQVTEPVDMFIGDQEDSLIYLADAGQDRILVFRKDGTYLRQHQAAEGTPLRDLRGIFVDEITSKIYLLTQSSLYQHPLSE